MKHTQTYFLLIPVVAILLMACMGDSKSKKIPSLAETFSKNDKKPFGANIAYRQLATMLPDNEVIDKKQPFTKTWENISDTAAFYVCITSKLFVNDEEVDAMMEYISAGNNLFISAGYIDETLLKRIGCNEKYSAVAIEEIAGNMNKTAVSTLVKPNEAYAYYYFPFSNYFFNLDSSTTKAIGYNMAGQPNEIVYFLGNGKLFLHCEPRALSNYFLLKESNYKYMQHALAFTQTAPQHVYWDDYYSKLRNRKRGKNDEKSFSAFSEIMKYPPLQYAFWLSLILLLLYIRFGGKRVQRVIEQLKPNENTTVTFTETIGRLYLQKKDNKNIADKMITYFNEYIRNTYFLNTNHINDDFIVVLTRKSGVEKNRVDTLYRTIIATQGSDVVNDYQLLSLQEQIQNFYKKRGNKN